MGCARSGGGQLRKGAPCQQHRQAVAQGLRQRLAGGLVFAVLLLRLGQQWRQRIGVQHATQLCQRQVVVAVQVQRQFFQQLL